MLVSLLIAVTLSMFVNDTPVLVLLLPIFVALAARGAMPASKTLMPINAAVLIGGMATTIGTSTNLLVVSIARDLGMPQMNVFHFTPIVLIAAAVALPYLWLVMPRLLPDHSKDADRAPRHFSARLRIPANSDLVGSTIEDVSVRLPAACSLDERHREVLEAGQKLRISGTHEAIEEAIRALKCEVAPGWVIERIQRSSREQGEDIHAVEMAVTADSRLIGRTLANSSIADLYGTAVLGIHRPRRPLEAGPFTQGLFDETGEMRISEGDVLLVMGLPAELQEFAHSDSLLMLEGAREMPRRSKALLALAIMFGAVGLASVGLLPIAVSALAGAILMFITGCVKFERVGRALSGKVIVLIAASIAIGELMLLSGAAQWLGDLLAAGLQFLPPAGVLAAIMLFVTVLTNFASNATAATVGTPIAFAIAEQLGLPREPLVLAVLFGCNLCYATPVAYQTNMLIMGEGNYTFGDYVRAGVPLVLLMVLTLSLLLAFFYRM
jgi:di/tricarboxylate transporter